eukprot:6484085-Amphidinium_carterae.2
MSYPAARRALSLQKLSRGWYGDYYGGGKGKKGKKDAKGKKGYGLLKGKEQSVHSVARSEIRGENVQRRTARVHIEWSGNAGGQKLWLCEVVLYKLDVVYKDEDTVIIPPKDMSVIEAKHEGTLLREECASGEEHEQQCKAYEKVLEVIVLGQEDKVVSRLQVKTRE